MKTITRILAMYLLACAFALQGFMAAAQWGDAGAVNLSHEHNMASSEASAHASPMLQTAGAMPHACNGVVGMQASDIDNSEHSMCCHHYSCNANTLMTTSPLHLPHFAGAQTLVGSAKRLHKHFYTGALERPPRTLLV